MYSLFQIFVTGMLISFLGTLPPGSLNIAAMQVAIEERTRNAVWFALGVALVEVLYVRVSLQATDWVTAHRAVFQVLEWVTATLFVVLAASSFLAARGKAREKKSLLLNNTINRFWLGFSMSAINPVQIPFWFIWSAYLLSTHVLQPSAAGYSSYIAGIGLGTMAGLAVFIFCGRGLIIRMNAGRRAVNVVVGLVFLVSAVIEVVRLAQG